HALRRVLDGRRTPALRLLVVDDDVEVAETLAEALGDRPGRRVAVAHAGGPALGVALDLLPQVVLCDLELGREMSGYEVARAFRADERLRSARLLALTGHERRQCLAGAREAGFDDVLTKPVDLQRLEEALLLGG